MERLHLRVKHVVEHIRNTAVFERSALSSLINAHISSLESHRFGDTLVGPLRRLPGTNVSTSSRMTVSGLTTTRGDIVFMSGCVGVVRACALDGDTFFALVEALVHVAPVSAHSARWRLGGPLEAWPADALVAASAWYFAGAAELVVLRSV